MTADPTEPAGPTEARRTSGGRSREVTVLAVLLAVALVIIAMLLMRPAPGSGTQPPAAVSASGGSGSPTSGAPGSSPSSSPVQKVRDTARHKAGDPLALGKADAPVTMIEYADYACPFCARFALETQPALVKRYVDEGRLRIEWHDMVIFGDKSRRAAVAARAAGQQGKFWEFHHALFAASPTSGHPDLTDARLEDFARTAGVPDLARWRADLASPALAEEVASETQTAQELGATSTPAFVVDGVPMLGAQPEDAFASIIDKALAEAGRH